MKYKIIICGMIFLIITICFSGCEETSKKDETYRLSDGTIVNGNIENIQIINYNIEKKRMMNWNETQSIWKIQDGKIQIYTDVYQDVFYVKSCIVPWNLDINDIDSDINKRKEIYLSFIESNKNAWIQDDRIPITPFTAYTHHYNKSPPENWEWEWDGRFINPEHAAYVVTNLTLGNQPIWYVEGLARNIGNTTLYYTKIVVNFYNEFGKILASENFIKNNISSNDKWNFSVIHNGIFGNEINHISFEVIAKKPIL